MRDDDEREGLANTIASSSGHVAPISGLEATVAPISSDNAAPVSGLDATVAPTSSQDLAPVSGDDATVAPSVVRAPAPKIQRGRDTRVAGADVEDRSHDHHGLNEVSSTDYALGDELARGGMGRIRRARDLRLGRQVAVKELLVKEPYTVERFEREIRLTARLQHPSIVSIYEAGRWPSGEPFYAMRMVPGEPLDDVIEPLTKLAQRIELLPNVIAIVEALAYAHDQGIIHRDLKPGNVLIGPFGETVVIDWGLAKDLNASEPSLKPRVKANLEDPEGKDLTVDGAVMGTPAYMPPEQAAGEPVDARADVYALGAILYHVLGGKAPFVGKTVDDLLIKVLTKSPTPVTELAEGIPPDLTTIVAKAMAREPSKRYASARELAADLKRFQTGQLVGAHAYSRLALFRRWLRRHRAAVTVGAFSLVALAVIAVLSVRNIVRERDRAEAATKEEERQRIAATAAKDEAVLASARLHFDQGRQELLAGNPLRAAVLARAALVEDTPATRLLAGLALAPLSSLRRRFEPLDEPILAAGFTNDGTSVFAATMPGRIRIWDAKTGQRTRSFDRGSRLTDAGLSPDASTLIVINTDAEIEVWDVATGKQRGTIAIPGGVASRADFSRDGASIAVIGDNLTIWRTDTLQQTATGPSFGDLMDVMMWSPDGTSVAFGGGSHGTIMIVETNRWTSRLTINAPSTEIRGLAFSPDSKRLAYVTAGGGAILDARTGKQLVVIDGPDQQRANQYVAIDFNADGTSLAISTQGDHAKLVDGSTGKTKRVLTGYAMARFSSDGTKLLSFGTSTGKVGLWDVATGTVFDELAGHAREIADAMFAPDGTSVLTASGDGSLALWKVAPSKAEARTKLRQRARSVVFTSNKAWMITASDDGTADIYDARTGTFARTLGTPLGVPAVPILTLVGDSHVLTVLGTGQVAELWDLATGARVASFDAKSPIQRAEVVGGNRVFTATHTQLAVWDAATGTQVASFETPEPEEDPPTMPGHQASATVTADGLRALIPATGGLGVFDVSSKARRTVIPVKGDVWSTVASPAGKRAVVIGESGTTLFDLENLKAVASLSAQGELVEEVLFSEDGHDVFARGTDSAIRRWNAETGTLEATSVIDDGVDLQQFAMQPGGALLATRANNVVRLWDTRTGKLLSERDIALDANGMGTLLAFTHDGRIVASGMSGMLWAWTLPTWTATPSALDTILQRDVPWSLVDGTLNPRSL